jgi:hypothetical protein
MQCESYLRLTREGLTQQNEAVPDIIDVESLVTDGDDDKVYGAMGVAKTIGAVPVLSPSCSYLIELLACWPEFHLQWKLCFLTSTTYFFISVSSSHRRFGHFNSNFNQKHIKT